jgi:hypothetical protein
MFACACGDSSSGPVPLLTPLGASRSAVADFAGLSRGVEPDDPPQPATATKASPTRNAGRWILQSAAGKDLIGERRAKTSPIEADPAPLQLKGKSWQRLDTSGVPVLKPNPDPLTRRDAGSPAVQRQPMQQNASTDRTGAVPAPELPELIEAPPSAAPAPPHPPTAVPNDVPVSPSDNPIGGETAYAVETIRCEGTAGTWVTLYKGRIRGDDGANIQIALERRYGLFYYPTAEGIAEGDWYCVPRRRYCYAQVSFSNWGGRYREHEIGVFPRDSVAVKVGSLILAVDPIIHRVCPRSTTG